MGVHQQGLHGLQFRTVYSSHRDSCQRREEARSCNDFKSAVSPQIRSRSCSPERWPEWTLPYNWTPSASAFHTHVLPQPQQEANVVQPGEGAWYSRRHHFYTPSNENGRNSTPNPAMSALNKAKKTQKLKSAQKKGVLTRSQKRVAERMNTGLVSVLWSPSEIGVEDLLSEKFLCTVEGFFPGAVAAPLSSGPSTTSPSSGSSSPDDPVLFRGYFFDE